MKKYILQILITLLIIYVNHAFSQDYLEVRVSGNYQNTSLKDVLVDLQEKTAITFSYVEQHMIDIPVSIAFEQQPLKEVLNKIFQEHFLSYKVDVETNAIIVFRKNTRYTINGFVIDAKTGETLIRANVYDSKNLVGTTTNRHGFFSLTLPATDSLFLAVAYIGYQDASYIVNLNRDHRINIRLTPSTIDADTVSVHTRREERIDRQVQMSVMEVPIRQVDQLPALGGEVDIMKTLQLLPGVQGGAEGSSRIFVRGGNPDQNLILLDGAPVYNASHLFGFMSVFNSDALKQVKLMKGGFPARFGGRLSSVMDIHMKEGNNQAFTGKASLGLISSRILLEGPLVKGRSSFMISGRRTYLDLLANAMNLTDDSYTEEKEKAGYYFYDLNAKLNYTLSPRDQLFISVYGGRDRMYGDNSISKVGFEWGNITSTLRWNHIFSNKLFCNTMLIYSDYRFQAEYSSSSSREYILNKFFSGIQDVSGKIELDFIPNPNHYIRFGGSMVRHTFTPEATQKKSKQNGQTNLDTSLVEDIPADEFDLYLEDQINWTKDLSTNLGVHGSLFQVDNKRYTSLQPRIAANYQLRDGWAVKSSFVTMTQYITLLTNSGIGLPTDLWLPATQKIKPQQAWQGALGVAHSFGKDQYELSIEGYYKEMNNIIEYKPGSEFLSADVNWQDKVELGKGHSYGTELLLQKKSGKNSGWLGYGLSWSKRHFPGLNKGREFPHRYDRRHNITLAFTRHFSKRLELGLSWVYRSGEAISLPVSRFSGVTYNYQNPLLNHLSSEYIWFYKGRNGFRMPAYHRLDINLQYHKGGSKRQHTFVLGIYNAYNRKNAFFLHPETDYSSGQEKMNIKQYSLFPIIPSVSYNVTF